MSVLPLDPDSDLAPFEQLRTQVARRVASGDLAPGTRLPTVRALAAQLGLATNTVARAYRELEVDGVVTTGGRRGTFVASSLAAGGADARAGAAAYVETARRLGLGAEEAHRLLDEVW